MSLRNIHEQKPQQKDPVIYLTPSEPDQVFNQLDGDETMVPYGEEPLEKLNSK